MELFRQPLFQLHQLAPRTMLIMDIVTSTQDAITQSSESLRLGQNGWHWPW